ncbi:DUF6343 family protein [Streptomyces corynorhini]|uniref:Uncharacterized protein n=1 Tax=Streptomyces corynorhini TaxID=2282652 RepID=A0A370BFZ2_9ACTN|nr:DUF6343 family protein [Streptomyces corynorhini]RDG39194.1 hypothetical protein DVH02_05340 [Streptomyces corynorhini]
MRTRTGSEPVTARSPLRMRFWLSLWGVFWTGAGTVVFALAGRPWWALACAVLLLIVVTDLVVILRHFRQGPRFQPGRDVGPYPPGHGPNVILTEDRERERDLIRQRRNRTGMGGGRRRS